MRGGGGGVASGEVSNDSVEVVSVVIGGDAAKGVVIGDAGGVVGGESSIVVVEVGSGIKLGREETYVAAGVVLGGGGRLNGKTFSLNRTWRAM